MRASVRVGVRPRFGIMLLLLRFGARVRVRVRVRVTVRVEVKARVKGLVQGNDKVNE